jgi:hypothetical protein
MVQTRIALCLMVFLLHPSLAGQVSAALVLYEGFAYSVGENLGGVDPDGAGPTAGTPLGQINPMTGAQWIARSTAGNYQAPNDVVISAGSLSYAGLATSTGNSVSYGSATANSALYANSIALPTSVSSGDLYASFLIRLKSNTDLRHSPASFVTDVSSSAVAGSALAGQGGTAVAMPGSFWVRRDPLDGSITNFSPSKSSGDGIGAGAIGPSAGYQHSGLGANVESNQFGDLDGQAAPDFNNPSSYQTYFVVIKYSFDSMPLTNSQSDTVSLWVNPGVGTLGVANGELLASQAAVGDIGSYYGALNAFGTGALDVASAIHSFALIGHRQTTSNTLAVDFDELRIGTTWEAVTPAAVPEPSVWGALGLCGWLATGRNRRRRSICR